MPRRSVHGKRPLPRHPWHQRGDRWAQVNHDRDAAAADARYWRSVARSAETRSEEAARATLAAKECTRLVMRSWTLAAVMVIVLGLIGAGIVWAHLHGR